MVNDIQEAAKIKDANDRKNETNNANETTEGGGESGFSSLIN